MTDLSIQTPLRYREAHHFQPSCQWPLGTRILWELYGRRGPSLIIPLQWAWALIKTFARKRVYMAHGHIHTSKVKPSTMKKGIPQFSPFPLLCYQWLKAKSLYIKKIDSWCPFVPCSIFPSPYLSSLHATFCATAKKTKKTKTKQFEPLRLWVPICINSISMPFGGKNRGDPCEPFN